MNNEIFEKAQSAYEAKNFEEALNAFTECLQDSDHPLSSGEIGLLYHQIGNSLVKLGDFEEAIHAYTQATVDAAYDDIGTVNNNLGMSYAALHDYENAVTHFELAVADAKYATPYKAYAAMGNSLLKLGKSAEAGVAFRQAALDDNNPDPTKSLLNLGVCFMALERPQDAIASYESALQFDMPAEMKNKLCSNLGQAYVASGQMQKAVTAFESALSDKTYFLSDSASVDYQRAVAAVASASAQEVTQAIAVPTDADMSGLDVTSDGEPVAVDETGVLEVGIMQDDVSEDDDRFFNATDEELEQWSKGLAKQERKRRGGGLKVLIVFFALIVVLFGAGLALYFLGFGFPSQESVAKDLFSDPKAAAQTAFAQDLPEDKIETMLAPVVKDSSVKIDGVDQSMTESAVYATAATPEGGEMQYKISFVRGGVVGWKIANIELYFESQQQTGENSA